MECPTCHAEHYMSRDVRVVNSRESRGGIRRRRECSACGARFSTHEEVEPGAPWVEKRDGSREPFSEAKLRASIAHAFANAPGAEQVESIADRLAVQICVANTVTPSSEIGELVVQELREIAPVACVRFASIFYRHTGLDQFMVLLAGFMNANVERKAQ